VDDSRRIASNRIFSKKECGLPENYFIFCSFNNHYKYNPHVLNLWAKILSQVGQSVLWIPYHNEQFSKNIAAEFESRGINRDRLVFATQLELMADHLARYALADLFLDCYPYSAQTTALDSLKTGVPLLTLQGKSLCSRMASSILSAINLASNPAKLANIKQKVLDNRFTTTLFNTRLYTKHIEVAYKKIMERHWSGLPIDHINIQ
jgi:predicted O-linked N-acetylglucosamine transferase (SPINDLY family)